MAMPPARTSVHSMAKPKRSRRGLEDDAGRGRRSPGPMPSPRDARRPGRSCGRPRSCARLRRARPRRSRRAGGLVPEELLERGEVGLQRGLDDVRREAVAGDRVARCPRGRSSGVPGPAPGPARPRRRRRPGSRSRSGTGYQPMTGSTAASTAPKSASTGPLPSASALTAWPFTTSETLPRELPPWLELIDQPSRRDRAHRRRRPRRRHSAACCSTSATRSASVTSFLTSARAMAGR